MAKMAKMMLATRNPVVGEFMRALLLGRFNLSVRNTTVVANFSIVACPGEARLADVTTTARYGIVPRLPRRDAACTRMPRTARPINTMVDPDAGRTIAL
jgi:hypothetical protein